MGNDSAVNGSSGRDRYLHITVPTFLRSFFFKRLCFKLFFHPFTERCELNYSKCVLFNRLTAPTDRFSTTSRLCNGR